VVAVALLAASCGGASPSASSTPAVTWVAAQGGTITVGIDQAPTGCNPNTAAGDTDADQLALAPVLPSAFTVNSTGMSTLNTDLLLQAELVDTSPQTVVYTINPKAVWSDGTPITAADFIYAWEQQRGTVSSSQYPEGDEASTLGYDAIASMTPSNKGETLTVVFATPFADWQMLFHDLVPAHVMAKAGWDPSCTTVDPAVDLSGGPFVITSVRAGGRVITYARNPRWWGQAPLLDHLVLRVGTGAAQLARWLARGTAQVVYPSSFDPSFLVSVTALPTTASEVDVSSTFLSLEFSMVSPALSNVDVRQAVAHTVDRQALVTSVVAWADETIVPSASHLYVQTQPSYPGPPTTPPNVGTTTTVPVGSPTVPFPLGADPAETEKLFIDSGYSRAADGTWQTPAGAPLTLRLVVDGGDPWAVTTAGLLARQIQRAGIGITTTVAASATAAGSTLAAGQADLALIPRTTSPYPSQTATWYTPVLGPPGEGGSQNWTNNDDTVLNRLFTTASQELNPVTAEPTYAAADKQLWTTMVALPLFAEPTAVAWSENTVGITANPHGPSLLWDTVDWGVRAPVPIGDPTTSVKVGPNAS
jgi:peptide/nickel transport system substrate-binding protein